MEQTTWLSNQYTRSQMSKKELRLENPKHNFEIYVLKWVIHLLKIAACKKNVHEN